MEFYPPVSSTSTWINCPSFVSSGYFADCSYWKYSRTFRGLHTHYISSSRIPHCSVLYICFLLGTSTHHTGTIFKYWIMPEERTSVQETYSKELLTVYYIYWKIDGYFRCNYFSCFFSHRFKQINFLFFLQGGSYLTELVDVYLFQLLCVLIILCAIPLALAYGKGFLKATFSVQLNILCKTFNLWYNSTWRIVTCQSLAHLGHIF